MPYYRLNAQKLSPEDRESLFKKIDRFAFTFSYDINNPGCVEFLWDLKEDVVSSMNIPNECEITVICKS